MRILVAIEVDLASSLAIRYACQLGNFLDLEITPVYITGPAATEPASGVGWVRRTWEREIIEQGKEEISQLISSEMDFCAKLSEPKVIYGDRVTELMKLMEQEAFDMYVEGAPYPFNPATLHKRLNLKLYQSLRTPVIWLRVLRKINQVLILCPGPASTVALAQTFRHFWAGCTVPLHLGFPPRAAPELCDALGQAQEDLQAAGCQVTLLGGFSPDSGWSPEEALKDYGLVAVALEKDIRKDSPKLQWISEVKNPLMLVFL
jgi:hypothetical protein